MKLIFPNDTAIIAELEIREDPIGLSLAFDGNTITEYADDYFSAMCALRGKLENQQIQMVCYGASRTVYLSGMALSMGAGEQAYRLTLGKSALHADLVSIFDSGSDVIPATVDDQQAFYRQWLTSLENAQAKSEVTHG